VLGRLESLEGELRALRAALQVKSSRESAAPAVEMGRGALARGAVEAPRFQEAMPVVPNWKPVQDVEKADQRSPLRGDDGGMRFPHFQGRPVGPIPDRVEVTYEGPDEEEPEELPESALLFEAEDEADDEPARDLSEFGAVEIRE
jgi:hypothetical protein